MVILQQLRTRLLNELHRDHSGMSLMKSVARSYMWWENREDGSWMYFLSVSQEFTTCSNFATVGLAGQTLEESAP